MSREENERNDNRAAEVTEDQPTLSPGRIKFALILALIGFAAFSLLLGRYPKPGFLLPGTLMQDSLAQSLVWNLRLPRLIAAVLLGCVLGAAGMVFQMIFANPLVEPGFLGVSQGAAFGAAFSIILLGNNAWMVQGSAMVFAILGLTFSYTLAHRIRFGGWILRLILAGISVSALYSAGLGVLKVLADPLLQLAEITFWLLGGLWSVTWDRLLSVLPVGLLGLAVVHSLRWRLNLLSLNDETAFSLGALPGRERTILLAAAVASTAAVISISGIIGWVGLIVPHISRRIFGADAQHSLQGSIIIGGLFMLICDDVARTLLAGEIPLGILTSFLGAVLFLILMSVRRRRRRTG
ncbi:MAG TPA: iron ABC transporter permease [Spirochaetia bacterium]|nr:iron ABC transporter permease [Spirochaetia bacterium]